LIKNARIEGVFPKNATLRRREPGESYSDVILQLANG
jgi:hypothetical protein